MKSEGICFLKMADTTSSYQRTKTNLFLGQYLSHKLVRAFNYVLLILADLIILNIFG